MTGGMKTLAALAWASMERGVQYFEPRFGQVLRYVRQPGHR